MNARLTSSVVRKISQNTHLECYSFRRIHFSDDFAPGLRYSTFLESPSEVTQGVHLSTSDGTQTATKNDLTTQVSSLLFRLSEVAQ